MHSPGEHPGPGDDCSITLNVFFFVICYRQDPSSMVNNLHGFPVKSPSTGDVRTLFIQ